MCQFSVWVMEDLAGLTWPEILDPGPSIKWNALGECRASTGRCVPDLKEAAHSRASVRHGTRDRRQLLACQFLVERLPVHWIGRWDGCCPQELGALPILLPVSIGQNSIMPESDESFGQGMQKKPPHELVGWEGH